MRYSQVPWAPKLTTSVGQANLTGQHAWQLTNCRALADGSIRKRFGWERWSKYVLFKEPTDAAHKHNFSLVGDWVGLDDFDIEDTLSMALVDSQLRVYNDGTTTTEDSAFHRQQNSTDLTAENRIAVRVLLRCSNLPATRTAARYFTIEIAVSTTKAILASFADAGVYGTAVGPTAPEYATAVDGEWHVWEFLHTVGQNDFDLYKDETLVKADIPTTTGTYTTGRVTVKSRASASADTVESYLDYIQVSSATLAADSLWTAKAVRGLFEQRNSVQVDTRVGKRYVISHAGTSVFADKVLDGRPVQIADDLISAEGVPSYCVFRDSLYFTDSIDLRLRQWNTVGAAVINAYAPKCAFIRPYSARLWLGGDPTYPLRVYFSGIRNANDWTTQTTGTFTTSGFIDLEEHAGGDRLVALHGPWNGLLICQTERTVQVIDATGGDPNLFSRRTIVYGLGAAGANGSAVAGNDIFFMSRRGVHRLSTTEKFGDIQQAFSSLPVDNLWWSDRSEHYIIQATLPNMSAASYRPDQLALWAIAMDDSSNNNYLLVYDGRLESWYLWDLDVASIVEFTAPDEGGIYLLFGDYDGYINLLGPHLIQDNGTDFTMTVESGRLDLRDFPAPDVQLRDHVKRFKSLHLHLKPLNANATTALTCFADERDSTSYTVSHDQFSLASLGVFVVGTDRLRASETIEVATVPLDLRAKYLRFQLTQAASDLQLLGWELEFEDEGSQRAYK